MFDVEIKKRKWVRSKDGWVAGVFEGLGRNFNLDPNLLRFIWLLSLFVFGSGILIYFILSLVLPREDRLKDYDEKKLLGVCLRLSNRTGTDLGLIRLLAISSLIVSIGTTSLIYILMYFFVDEQPTSKNFFNY